MQVRKINPNNKRDVRKFTLFPFDLYRHTPLWVPPLISEFTQSIKGNHPFFKHSEGDFFIAEDAGKVLGRIAVMDNHRANRFRGTKTAFFGFFEVVEDQEVSSALFHTAFEWARKRGLNRIIGPRGLIGSDSSGILVDGFEHRPALGVPYNLPYYDAFIKASGFNKDTDHLSGYLPGDHILPERIQIIAGKQMKRRGFWIKSFHSKNEMRQWVPEVQAVHRNAFEGTHTFYPPTDEEMESIANTILSVAEPGLIKLIMKESEVVGFIFAYHDISPGIQKAGGRLWPFGWYHIFKERSRNNWVNINGVGMHPDFQGMGGNAILYAALEKSIKAFGFKHIDIVQVNETNFTSYHDMEAIGVNWYKRHRSYMRDI